MPNPIPADTRVAVCLVGAVRTLTKRFHYESVKANLLDTQLVPADLFLHLHLGWDDTKYAAGMGHHGAAGETFSASSPKVQRMIEHLKPVQTKFSDSGCENKEASDHPICRRHPSKDMGLAAFLQYFWVRQSHEAIFKYESEKRLTYAWVIRSRPDLAFFDRMPPAISFPSRRIVLMMKESRPAYFDGFWMAPGPLAKELSKALYAFYEKRSPRELPWPPEWHFFPWARQQWALPWVYEPLPAVLVRSHLNFDCWRLKHKETPSMVYDIEMSAWGRDPDNPRHVLSFEEACLKWTAKAAIQQEKDEPGSTRRQPPPPLHPITTPALRQATRRGFVASGSADPLANHPSLALRNANHTSLPALRSYFSAMSREAAPAASTSSSRSIQQLHHTRDTLRARLAQQHARVYAPPG